MGILEDIERFLFGEEERFGEDYEPGEDCGNNAAEADDVFEDMEED